MHPAALRFVAAAVGAYGPFRSVVEIGSRDINGSVRHLFDGAESYVGLDPIDGPGVDVVQRADEYAPPSPVEAVVCCEVLEHDEGWRGTVAAAAGWLAPGGHLIITCAAPGRRPHSGVDGGWGLHPGEWYENVGGADLGEHLAGLGLRVLICDSHERDTQAVAVRDA